MKIFKVIFEIDIDADNPTDAAEKVQRMIQEETDANWQWYVNEHGSKDIYSVDLEEEIEDACIQLNIAPHFFD